MTRRKRTLYIISVLLVLLIALSCQRVYQQIEQERKDQALIAAVKDDNTSRALELLNEGADGNARDNGETPSLRQVLQRFLKRFQHSASSPPGQSNDEKHPTALALLYNLHWSNLGEHDDQGPDLTLVRALLDHHADVNARDEGGRSPLWCACRFSNVDAVQLLLQRGADIEAADEDGATPLMGEDEEMTRVLLEHGAKVDATDADGTTALMFAASNRCTEAVCLLLEHGAKVSAQDARGLTALYYATKYSDPRTRTESREIVALLRRHGAKYFNEH